ncbi:MAG TPA: hypothetical protein PKK06_08390 [Phycisphaerae bacterium]|nr:hypothetical protein [Phycisphaerae bacterium]HNU43672.1 hypothetical protein [Phycisphaerae bacterium]
MAFANRIPLIQRIQELRGSVVICYLTSLRPNVPTAMADDAVRVFFDHLLLLPTRPIEKLDVFLCSNGGSGTVPWRLASLFREFAKAFCVLVPYRAYSAASLLALGADEIVMHPFAELGPIDPTVSNEFNPVEQGTGRRLGISVEDLRAYVDFVKSTVGITHEDELVKTIEILAQKIHPLAIGNVERFLLQSRMIAKKILRTHMKDADDHTLNDIVENMASKLYFHGHPINRKEAKNDLRLKVLDELPPGLESCMWDLYKDFEAEFDNLAHFNPAADLARETQMQPGATREYTLVHVMIESDRLSSKQATCRRFTLQSLQPGQQAIREDILSQGWTHSSAPVAESPPLRLSSSAGGAPARGTGRQEPTAS